MKTAFAALIFAGLTQTAVLADGNTGGIRGVVRQYYTGRPLSRVEVLWTSPTGGFSRTKTDNSGRFYFLVVPPGVTYVSLSASGFNVTCLRGVVHANETIDVTVDLYPSPGDWNGRCPPLHLAGHEAVEDSLQR